VIPILAGLFLAAGLGASTPTAAGKPVAAAKKKVDRLTPKQRARQRKALARQLRANPLLALDRGFVKKAALSEFHLPLSVRLRSSNGLGGFEPSDDQLEIAWDTSVFQWPLLNGIPAATQTVFLSGGFTMEQIYIGGDTTGYGELGATEAIIGGGVKMSSDPFKISEFAAACASGPQLVTAPNTQVPITSAGARYGVMNMFSQEIRGTLSMRMTFAAQRTTGCGNAPVATDTVDNTTAPPMPVRFSGKLTVSPSITADGKIRFAKITIDDAVTPQLSTFAFVRSCTEPAAPPPPVPPAPPCSNPLSFPARLKFKKMTAEVLLGDVLP
jgi:hypothetical protein